MVDTVGALDRLLPDAGHGPGLLERVAGALTSALELEEVLSLLGRVALDATRAAGAAVLLLDGRTLRPGSVVREIETEDLQRRFHEMEPLELDELRYALLAAGRAVSVRDAREGDLIPAQWVERFSLRGVSLVPLVSEGEPLGLLVVDWDEVRTFGADDVTTVEAVGAYAAVAIRAARQYAVVRRQATVQAVLARSAAELASPVAPTVIAGRLADSFRELVSAQLCAVALLDPRWQEITSLAVSGGCAVESPLAFAAVPVEVVDHLIERLTFKRRPVPVDRHAWFDDFLGGRTAGAVSYMAVPVVLGDYARGIVLLGFGAGRGSVLTDDEASAAEVLAGLAAAAIERYELLDRLDTQVHRLAALESVSAALNSSASLAEVLDVVCSAFGSILGTSHCSVNLLDDTDPSVLRAVAHRGLAWFAGRAHSVSAVPRAEVAKLVHRWTSRPLPVVYEDVAPGLVTDAALVPDDVRSAALFPLMQGDAVVGVVVCGFAGTGDISSSALDVGQALADLAASALDRAALNEALQVRLRQVEALYRLSDVVATTANLDDALCDLDALLRPELAARVGTLCLDDESLRVAVGARAPDREERAAIRAWAARVGPLRTWPTAAGVLVPVSHQRKVLGALRVTIGNELEPADEDLLHAIGTGCGDIIHKAALHRDAAERERRLAIASERERIAGDLHDSVGQIVTGMGMLLNDCVRDAPDEAWKSRLQALADLAARSSHVVRDSIYALLFLDTRRHGLVPSLRELAQRFESTTGLRVTLDVHGEVDVAGLKEDVLFRSAHEALMNVERHARASRVVISVRQTAKHVVLLIDDDGVGMRGRPAGVEDGHFGLRAVRQRLDEVGGEVRIRSKRGRGTVLEVRVPAAPRGRQRAGRG